MDLAELQDCHTLHLALEILSDQQLPQLSQGRLRVHHIENAHILLNFLKANGVGLAADEVSAEDMASGDPTAWRQLLWAVFIRFQVSEILSFFKHKFVCLFDPALILRFSSLHLKKNLLYRPASQLYFLQADPRAPASVAKAPTPFHALLAWCTVQLQRINMLPGDRSLTDFNSSFRDGTALFHLVMVLVQIVSASPELEAAPLPDSDPTVILQDAVEVANQALTVTPVVENVQDLLADERALAIYLCELHRKYSELQPDEAAYDVPPGPAPLPAAPAVTPASTSITNGHSPAKDSRSLGPPPDSFLDSLLPPASSHSSTATPIHLGSPRKTESVAQTPPSSLPASAAATSGAAAVLSRVLAVEMELSQLETFYYNEAEAFLSWLHTAHQRFLTATVPIDTAQLQSALSGPEAQRYSVEKAQQYLRLRQVQRALFRIQSLRMHRLKPMFEPPEPLLITELMEQWTELTEAEAQHRSRLQRRAVQLSQAERVLSSFLRKAALQEEWTRVHRHVADELLAAAPPSPEDDNACAKALHRARALGLSITSRQPHLQEVAKLAEALVAAEYTGKERIRSQLKTLQVEYNDMATAIPPRVKLLDDNYRVSTFIRRVRDAEAGLGSTMQRLQNWQPAATLAHSRLFEGASNAVTPIKSQGQPVSAQSELPQRQVDLSAVLMGYETEMEGHRAAHRRILESKDREVNLPAGHILSATINGALASFTRILRQADALLRDKRSLADRLMQQQQLHNDLADVEARLRAADQLLTAAPQLIFATATSQLDPTVRMNEPSKFAYLGTTRPLQTSLEEGGVTATSSRGSKVQRPSSSSMDDSQVDINLGAVSRAVRRLQTSLKEISSSLQRLRGPVAHLNALEQSGSVPASPLGSAVSRASSMSVTSDRVTGRDFAVGTESTTGGSTALASPSSAAATATTSIALEHHLQRLQDSHRQLEDRLRGVNQELESLRASSDLCHRAHLILHQAQRATDERTAMEQRLREHSDVHSTAALHVQLQGLRDFTTQVARQHSDLLLAVDKVSIMRPGSNNSMAVVADRRRSEQETEILTAPALDQARSLLLQRTDDNVAEIQRLLQEQEAGLTAFAEALETAAARQFVQQQLSDLRRWVELEEGRRLKASEDLRRRSSGDRRRRASSERRRSSNRLTRQSSDNDGSTLSPTGGSAAAFHMLNTRNGQPPSPDGTVTSSSSDAGGGGGGAGSVTTGSLLRQALSFDAAGLSAGSGGKSRLANPTLSFGSDADDSDSLGGVSGDFNDVEEDGTTGRRLRRHHSAGQRPESPFDRAQSRLRSLRAYTPTQLNSPAMGGEALGYESPITPLAASFSGSAGFGKSPAGAPLRMSLMTPSPQPSPISGRRPVGLAAQATSASSAAAAPFLKTDALAAEPLYGQPPPIIDSDVAALTAEEEAQRNALLERLQMLQARANMAAEIQRAQAAVDYLQEQLVMSMKLLPQFASDEDDPLANNGGLALSSTITSAPSGGQRKIQERSIGSNSIVLGSAAFLDLPEHQINRMLAQTRSQIETLTKLRPVILESSKALAQLTQTHRRRASSFDGDGRRRPANPTSAVGLRTSRDSGNSNGNSNRLSTSSATAADPQADTEANCLELENVRDDLCETWELAMHSWQSALQRLTQEGQAAVFHRSLRLAKGRLEASMALVERRRESLPSSAQMAALQLAELNKEVAQQSSERQEILAQAQEAAALAATAEELSPDVCTAMVQIVEAVEAAAERHAHILQYEQLRIASAEAGLRLKDREDTVQSRLRQLEADMREFNVPATPAECEVAQRALTFIADSFGPLDTEIQALMKDTGAFWKTYGPGRGEAAQAVGTAHSPSPALQFSLPAAISQIVPQADRCAQHLSHIRERCSMLQDAVAERRASLRLIEEADEVLTWQRAQLENLRQMRQTLRESPEQHAKQLQHMERVHEQYADHVHTLVQRLQSKAEAASSATSSRRASIAGPNGQGAPVNTANLTAAIVGKAGPVSSVRDVASLNSSLNAAPAVQQGYFSRSDLTDYVDRLLEAWASLQERLRQDQAAVAAAQEAQKNKAHVLELEADIGTLEEAVAELNLSRGLSSTALASKAQRLELLRHRASTLDTAVQALLPAIPDVQGESASSTTLTAKSSASLASAEAIADATAAFLRAQQPRLQAALGAVHKALDGAALSITQWRRYAAWHAQATAVVAWQSDFQSKVSELQLLLNQQGATDPATLARCRRQHKALASGLQARQQETEPLSSEGEDLAQQQELTLMYSDLHEVLDRIGSGWQSAHQASEGLGAAVLLADSCSRAVDVLAEIELTLEAAKPVLSLDTSVGLQQEAVASRMLKEHERLADQLKSLQQRVVDEVDNCVPEAQRKSMIYGQVKVVRQATQQKLDSVSETVEARCKRLAALLTFNEFIRGAAEFGEWVSQQDGVLRSLHNDLNKSRDAEDDEQVVARLAALQTQFELQFAALTAAADSYAASARPDDRPLGSVRLQREQLSRRWDAARLRLATIQQEAEDNLSVHTLLWNVEMLVQDIQAKLSVINTIGGDQVLTLVEGSLAASNGEPLNDSAEAGGTWTLRSSVGSEASTVVYTKSTAGARQRLRLIQRDVGTLDQRVQDAVQLCDQLMTQHARHHHAVQSRRLAVGQAFEHLQEAVAEAEGRLGEAEKLAELARDHAEALRRLRTVNETCDRSEQQLAAAARLVIRDALLSSGIEHFAGTLLNDSDAADFGASAAELSMTAPQQLRWAANNVLATLEDALGELGSLSTLQDSIAASLQQLSSSAKYVARSRLQALLSQWDSRRDGRALRERLAVVQKEAQHCLALAEVDSDLLKVGFGRRRGAVEKERGREKKGKEFGFKRKTKKSIIFFGLISALGIVQLDEWLAKRAASLPTIVWPANENEPDFDAGIRQGHSLALLLAQQEAAVRNLRSRPL